MEINIRKGLKVLFLTAISILVLVSFVNAFAISSAYNSNTPIEIYPGETRNIQFKLMASSGEDNLVIRAELIDNGNVASLTDSNLKYNVNYGDIIPVNLRININNTAKIGEEHSIVLKFSDITPSEGEGSVSFKGSSTIGLRVLVIQPELKEGKGTGLLFIFGFFLLILIIAIILVIWLVVRNRRNRL